MPKKSKTEQLIAHSGVFFVWPQVVDLLHAMRGGRTMGAWAKEWDVDFKDLSHAYHGTRRPSREILERLGLRREIVYRRVGR